jgi:hypothetical protein
VSSTAGSGMAANAVQAPELPAQPQRRRARRWLRASVVLLLLVAVAVVAVIVFGDPFAGGGGSGGGGAPDNATPTSLASVARQSLSSRTEVSGTLGYASGGSVVNQANGAATWLPGAGQVIAAGQVLYRASDNPVVLLDGRTPAYRSLSEGMSGPDVQELNRNLVALGYATSATLDPSSDYFSAETVYALERLQAHLGVGETGTLTLGKAVFLLAPLRITNVTATLGTQLPADGVIAQTSSTARRVLVKLDASQQSSVKVSDRVTITLPNNSTIPGVVTGVGKVASSGGSSGGTVPVYITPLNPGATGTLDQAPVNVQITTATVKDALVVPVDALLALAGGGYAVEVVQGAVHHLVPVTPGLFDDADQLVQVSGSLSAGERVVVPAR